MTGNRPLIIAHRGASAAYRENTIEAFEQSAPLGADAVELDARRTADGEVVVHHDDRLEDGRALVELARTDLPSHVPSLAEALDACGDLVVNIEIKNWPDDVDFDPTEMVAEAVMAEVSGRPSLDPYLISCFHRPTIDRVRGEMPELATAYLHMLQDATSALAEAVEHGHGALHPWYGWVTEELVIAAHEQGVKVNPWTVDEPEWIEKLARWGVDGIVTNVPDVVLDLIG